MPMKPLFIMNAFKGTMTSIEMNQMLNKRFPNGSSFVYSDGGDGFLSSMESILKQPFLKREIQIFDPYLKEKRKATYLIQGDTAYIESAQTIGYRLSETKDVYHASTYPLGEMIKDALDFPIKYIKIGLGGSITNDLGSGMLEALQVRFLDKDSNPVHPKGNNLIEIQDMNLSCFDKRMNNIKVTAFSDVDNPLLGKEGATYCFAPQKGAKEQDLPELEKGMKNLAEIYIRKTGKDKTDIPGSGAAGGLGYALITFFDTTITSGSDFLLSRNEIKEAIRSSDCLFTGEGKVDGTSFHGKGSLDIIEKAKKENPEIHIVLLVGSIEEPSRRKLLEKYPDILILPMIGNAMEYPKEIRKQKAMEIFEKTVDLNRCKIEDMIK